MPIKGAKFPIRPCRWCGVQVTHAMDGWNPRDHFCPHTHQDKNGRTIRHKCWEGHWFGRPYAQPVGTWAPVIYSHSPLIQHGCDECLADYLRAKALDDAINAEVGFVVVVR